MIHLLQPAAPVLLVQLFWVSVAFIGWATTKAILRIAGSRFIDGWKDLPISAKFLLSNALGFLVFGLFTIIGYTFALPAWTLGVVYITILLASVIFAVWSKEIKNLRPRVKLTNWKLLFSPLGIMSILLVIDLVLTFFIGSFIGADGFVHVTKISHLVHHGFTLTDAYFGTVPETRHTISTLHTLIAIPSWLGVNPLTSWYASAVFLKLLRFAAIFYLAERLLHQVNKRYRIQLAAIAGIIALAAFNNYFISYPSYFVVTWIILFTIALLDLADGKNPWLLPIASLLIALTHPLNSLSCAILLGEIFVFAVLLDRKFLIKKNLYTTIISFVLLMSTPVFAATLPNRMTEAAKNFGIGSYFNLWHLGRWQGFTPTALQYFATNRPLIWCLSLLGIAGLLYLSKRAHYRLILISFFAYFFLFLANPIAFKIFSKFLPTWGVARFILIDQLLLITPLFGLLTLYFVIRKFTGLKLTMNVIWAICAAALVIFVFTQHYGAVDPVLEPHASMYSQQKGVYSTLASLSQVLPNDKNAVVLAEQNVDSFMIPVVSQLHVLAINDDNATPAADMVDRDACFKLVYNSLNPSLMKQVNIKYVLLRYSDPVYKLALVNPTLVEEKHNTTWVLFKFNSVNVKPAHNLSCYFHE